MADPATIVMVVKAAVAAATDKRTWKVVGVIIAAILTPFILITVMILSLLSGTSEHNNAAINLCFNGGTAASSVPAEYMERIESMMECFFVLDNAISDAEDRMDGSLLDDIRIKSIFYSLYFGSENLNLSDSEAHTFVNCFVTQGQDSQNQEVVIPASLETAYINLAEAGILVSREAKANALQIYQRIACGGAGTFTGEIEYGGRSSIALEGLTFIHLETKNNLDLVIYAKNAFDCGWGYVWGTYGDVLTNSLFESKRRQYPDGVGDYGAFILQHWLGRRTTDCAGLIKGYGWYSPDTRNIEYGTNGMPDVSADQMYRNAGVSGPMDTMPDTPGLAVWKSGHIGIYIGSGEVIEAMGTKYGVVKTKLDDRGWKAWLEVPYIHYITDQ